jgi:hypothetical protein
LRVGSWELRLGYQPDGLRVELRVEGWELGVTLRVPA